MSPLAIVTHLNRLGGRNGIGRIDIVENRFVGMKSRGVYEAPGMTILYPAHMMIEQLTLDRDLVHLRDRLAPEVAEMVYYGFWYSAKMDALLAFIREAQKHVTGEVTLKLYKGNIASTAAKAPSACTTKGSPAWKGAAATTRPTPKAFCGSRACPAACKAA